MFRLFTPQKPGRKGKDKSADAKGIRTLLIHSYIKVTADFEVNAPGLKNLFSKLNEGKKKGFMKYFGER